MLQLLLIPVDGFYCVDCDHSYKCPICMMHICYGSSMFYSSERSEPFSVLQSIFSCDSAWHKLNQNKSLPARALVFSPFLFQISISNGHISETKWCILDPLVPNFSSHQGLSWKWPSATLSPSFKVSLRGGGIWYIFLLKSLLYCKALNN